MRRKVNPELFLFSSPWSPPGWMKAGGSMLGGSMWQHYFAAYAQYFLKFLQGYAAEGEPGVVPVLVAVESSGMDESRRIDAGRIHVAALFRRLCAVLPEVFAGLCGGRGADPGRHGAERGGYRSGWAHAGLLVAAGVRDRICDATSGATAAAEWPFNQNLGARPRS